jgi:hypothetical protein
MTTAYTSLLGLALPVTGELSGTWGDTVNNSITSLLDSAIAGTQTLTADTTLTTTTGAANQSRQAILLCSPASANITITAPAQSKIYTVINTSATYTVTVRGVGPTTGVTLGVSEKAVVAWNGSDFVRISNTGGAGVFTSITDSGNLTFTGTGNRITGDFSNATAASRVAFQSSTTNGNTTVAAIPNGTSTTAALWAVNNSDIANTSRARIQANSTEISFTSDSAGTGTNLPMSFFTGGSSRLTIDANGLIGIKGAASTSWSSTYQVIQYNGGPALFSANNTNINLSSNIYNDGTNRYITSTSGAYVNVGTSGASLTSVQSGTAGNAVTAGAGFLVSLTDCTMTTANGGLGYSSGAGGTVTQGTSRTTGVTLSKPTGAITMFSAAGSAIAATFTVTNTLVAATDTIHLCQKSGTNLYVLLVTAVAAGSFNITFYTTGGVATDAPVINFAIIKGVTA